MSQCASDAVRSFMTMMRLMVMLDDGVSLVR